MVTALSPQSVIISWQPPLEEERNGQIIDYHINVTHYKGEGGTYVTVSASTSVVVNSLHPNYIYQCSVSSRTSAGLGPLKNVLLKLPPDGEKQASLINVHEYTLILSPSLSQHTAPTGYPQDVKAVASDSNTLHMYWSPPIIEQQNGDITQYGINITNIESGLVYQHNTSGPRTSFIALDLLPHKIYQCSVTAFTVIGHGPYSPVYTIQMPSAGTFVTVYELCVFCDHLFVSIIQLLQVPH